MKAVKPNFHNFIYHFLCVPTNLPTRWVHVPNNYVVPTDVPISIPVVPINVPTSVPTLPTNISTAPITYLLMYRLMYLPFSFLN